MNKRPSLPFFLKGRKERFGDFCIVYALYPQWKSYHAERRCSVIKEEIGFYWIHPQMRNKAVHHKQ